MDAAHRLGFALLLAVATGCAAAGQPDAPALLFKSGFEGRVTLSEPVLFGNGAWQDISGADRETGFTWPPKILGGTSRFQLIAGAHEKEISASTLHDYMRIEIQTVTGRKGKPTAALYSAVLKSVGGATRNTDVTQNVFHLFPSPGRQGDLYVSYWLKFQSDLLERMTTEEWAGRVVTDWKTGSGTGGGGDYRVVLSVFGDGAKRRLYWHLQGDNVADGGHRQEVFWQLSNTSVRVPVGEWFRVEVFVHRSSDADGRVWIAVGGQKLFDRYGPNTGVDKLPWNRIMPFINYSTGQSLPAYQWVDDLEIWDGFAPTASTH